MGDGMQPKGRRGGKLMISSQKLACLYVSRSLLFAYRNSGTMM
jgi:hypothetical protein